jgi:5'-nucleotidase
MKILVTNDDGIHAPGLAVLAETLGSRHEVVVVAPDRERSAVSHAITLNVPLRAVRVRNGAGYGLAVSGTPADCVKLALMELLKVPVDLVVSGINPGPNVGVNLNYSGTVSAAREAAIHGYDALAVSLSRHDPGHYDTAARFALKVAEWIGRERLPRGVFLNVNVPDLPETEIRGVRFCRQGRASIKAGFSRRVDPRNQVYYWQGAETELLGDGPDEDGVALAENMISVTPVKCDMTDHDYLRLLEGHEF